MSDILSDSFFMLSQVRERRRLSSERLGSNILVLIVGIYVRYTLVVPLDVFCTFMYGCKDIEQFVLKSTALLKYFEFVTICIYFETYENVTFEIFSLSLFPMNVYNEF